MGRHLLVQRRRPTDSGGRDCRAVVSAGAALGSRGVHRPGQRRVRRAAVRRAVPRQRSVRRGGRRRTGHRNAGASPSGAQGRNRRGLAAARGDRHRPHRARRGSRTPRSPFASTTARSIRTSASSCPASRSTPPRSPADRSGSSGRSAISIACKSTARSIPWSCGCWTTPCTTPRQSACRWLDARSASTSSGSRESTPGCALAERSACRTSASPSRWPATRTSGFCRVSSPAASAGRDAPSSRRRLTARFAGRCSPATPR